MSNARQEEGQTETTRESESHTLTVRLRHLQLLFPVRDMEMTVLTSQCAARLQRGDHTLCTGLTETAAMPGVANVEGSFALPCGGVLRPTGLLPSWVSAEAHHLLRSS